MRFVFHPIILFCLALTILSAAGASTYGTSGECLNQPTEYGYDLNDIHSDCPPTQFCSSSLVCVDRFSDGVPTQNQNPKVVCLNGASEVETTLGFLSSTVERLCSSNSVGEMCVSLPDPCTTNYCLDPWGFTYPAERVAETSSEVQLRESFEFLNKALNAKNRAFSEYVQSMNYAMLSSQAYLVYLKYLYYIRDKDINAFYEDFLSDKNLFQQTTVVDDDDYWYFQLAQTTCSTDNSSTVNRAANELFKKDSHYATTLMTVLDTFLDELEQLYLSHGLNYEESTASNPYKAYVRFRDMYRNPILSAAITFKDGTELPIDSNRCLELHNYADAKYKEKISNEKNADYNITLTYYQQTNASNPVLGYTKIKFKCREVCYDRDSHQPKTALSKNAFDNLIACPPSVPDCSPPHNPVPFSEHEGVSHIRGCSFNIDFGAMTINWNKDLEDGLHSRSGWSYVCAETRSPTKYTFSLVTCPQSYTIDTKEQCLSAALFLERPLDTQIYAEELVLKAPYRQGRNDGTGYTVEFMHFSCTSTHQLFPTNLSPTLNGCGPSVGYAGLVELFNDVALKPQDVDCCNAHDACYAGVECTEPGNCTAMDLSGGFSSKDCEDAFEKCISDIPDGQGSELAKSFPGRVLDLSPHFVSSDSFKCVDKSENNPANIQTRPNGYSFEKRLRFMIADGIDNCAGYTATDPLFTNHWSSNSSSQWTSQDFANSYSDFGPCGKYGTCLGVPNMQNSPPLMSVSPFTNENRQYHNNITCKCTRGQGYFCEESLCDNYCKNEGECTLIGGEPACDCVNGTWGPDCSMSSVEGSATGEWTRNGNDQAMWWVPYEANDLYTYEPMESDYGDDGADEVRVVVKSLANYACFGSMRSCSNNPENDADKSMVVMLTDMSEVGEEIENGMDWWRIQLAMDGGAAWDAKRQKGIEAVLPRFNYFDKKANASVEVLDQYKIFVAAEKNNYAEAHGKYTTDTDILAKLNWWNMYVDSITTFGTALLREQYPVQADTSVRVLNENSCNETTIRTQMEQIITEEGGIRKWPSSFNRDDKILQLLDMNQVYDPIEHRGWAYFSSPFNDKLGESGWLGDSERDTTLALLLVNVWIDSLESDVRQDLFRSLCRGNATLGIRHPPDIIEFDCDNIGEKSADGWTCCAMSNPEFHCYDGSCWIPDENITDSSPCSGDTTNGASATCTSTSTTTHNSCPTSTPCEQVGDQCAAEGGQVCCKMDTSDKCDSLTCWVSNDEILDGTQLLSSCTRAQETSCSSTRACDRPGNVCQDLEGREYVCCDYPLLYGAWLPDGEQCNSGNCWHQIDDLDSINLLFKESILIHAKKSRDFAGNSSQKAISANTAAQVSTQMFAAISLSREEGQKHRSLDFSIAALKQKPNVPLLGLSDFLDTMVEVIFSDASEELKSAVKISANVLTIPLQQMIPDIRSLKVALHLTEKVQHLSLTVRPHFVFSEANCQNAPETITCLLGSVAELAFGESEVSKFEQLMQSLKFKFKLQKKKDHKSFKATVALMLPIVLSDTNEMYIALENQNGGGPSIYLSHTKEKVEGAMTTKTVFGGEIPFRLKVGKKLDITIVGSFDYNIAKKQITLAARLPFWMMDVLPFTQIPIHIHDIGLKVDFFKSTNAAGDSGVNFQFMGGLCLGTENNCRMKTCDYIQGYIFKSVNLKKPAQNMDALLLSEVTFGKLLKVACSSEWFGYCDTYESKSQFMGEIASLEETAPWFINTGWSPLTPTCADPADTTGEGCCTRLEMIDPGKSFAKNCYSKIIVGGDYFAFKTSASTIQIEKGITVSGRAQFFGIAVGIYLKVNHWTTLGLLPRYKIDMHLQFDKFGIDGFLEVTQNETSAAGPYIAAAMMTPLKVDLSFQGYVKIVPLAIGVGISGRLHKTSKVSINASLTLFNQFDAQLQVEYWPLMNMMALYGGMNSVVVRVNSTGLNKFVAGAVASVRAGVAQSRTAITGAITTFQTNLISASGLCQSIFPTGGSLPASSNLLLAYFSFLGEGLFEVIKNFIEDSCTVIVGKILPVFLFGVNMVINGILALVDLMLMGVEALANGDLIVLDEFEASAAVGFKGAKGALKMKGKIFGFPFDVNPTFDATMANDGDLVGNILQIIKSHIGRRLAKTTDGRRRLSGNPDEVIQTMEAAIVAIGGVGQAIGDNLEAMFNEIVKFDFEKATEYLLQAVKAPQVALGFLNPGGRRRLFEEPDLVVNMAESMEAGLSTDGNQECDLLIDAAAQILQNPALKECKYGCGLWKGRTTCLECSISNHTECGEGKFCDLGRCIPKKTYGALVGIYDAETVCLSGKDSGDLIKELAKCIDCSVDNDCRLQAENACRDEESVGRFNGTKTSERVMYCDQGQCKSENIQPKRTDYVECLNVGGCCDRYGHLWEKGCSSGDVRRGETVTPKCGNNCCFKDAGTYTEGTECNKQTQIKRGEWKAESDSNYKMDPDKCFFKCCNLDGTDAGFNTATHYCHDNDYAKDAHLYDENCGYDCCKEGGLGHGAGFVQLPTDCKKDTNDGTCQCPTSNDVVKKGEDWHYQRPIGLGFHPSWIDKNGVKCSNGVSHGTYKWDNGQKCIYKKKGDSYTWTTSGRCLVGCCNDDGSVKDYEYSCPNKQRGQSISWTTSGTCLAGCCDSSGGMIPMTIGGCKFKSKGDQTYWKDIWGNWKYGTCAHTCCYSDGYSDWFRIETCSGVSRGTSWTKTHSGTCGHSCCTNTGYLEDWTRTCTGVSYWSTWEYENTRTCAHECCDEWADFPWGLNPWTCTETNRKDYVNSGEHNCEFDCCEKYSSRDVANIPFTHAVAFQSPSCTDYQTQFETGRAMQNFNNADYEYTRGVAVPVNCKYPCCFGSSVAAPMYHYCPDFGKNDIKAAGLWTETNNKWYSSTTKSLEGEVMQPTCKHHCCSNGGGFSSMEFHGECPATKYGRAVVKRGDWLAYTETCGTGCCATDGTMTDHYSDNEGCIQRINETSYLKSDTYGGHTPPGGMFNQELDCDTLFHGEWNDCRNNDCVFEDYGMYKPNCLHRTPLLLWSPKNIGGWGSFCNAKPDQDKWDAAAKAAADAIAAAAKAAADAIAAAEAAAAAAAKASADVILSAEYATSAEQWASTASEFAQDAQIAATEAAANALIAAGTHLSNGDVATAAAKAAQSSNSAQTAKNAASQAATAARLAATNGNAPAALIQDDLAFAAATSAEESTNATLSFANDVELMTTILVEQKRISDLGPFGVLWWTYKNKSDFFNGHPRAVVATNKYSRIHDRSCSYHGASPLSSATECQRAAEELGILFADYKVIIHSNSNEPVGCHLRSPSTDGNPLLLHYNEAVSSTTNCGWEEASPFETHDGGCLCIHKYATLSTYDTCDSAGLHSITSMEECQNTAFLTGLISPNTLVQRTTDTDASISVPHCFQRPDGVVEYNEVSKKQEPLLRQGHCSRNIATAAKCFAIADRMGLANRPRKFATAQGWDCNNIGDESDDGYKCCSSNHNGCTDGTCWWSKSKPLHEVGTCSQTVTTPIEGTWEHRPSGCFLLDFTPHFNTFASVARCSEGSPCICDDLLRIGTCESNGYATLKTAAECWQYATERGHLGVPSNVHLPDAAPGCSVDVHGVPHFNTHPTPSLCSDSDGCICDTLLRSGTCNSVIKTKHECFKSALAKGFRSGYHTSGTWEHVPAACSIDTDGNPRFNYFTEVPHLPSIACSDTFGCVCSTITGKKCDTAECKRLLCRNRHTSIRTGTCASNGYSDIRSEHDCQTAATLQNQIAINDEYEAGPNALLASHQPAYCSMNHNGVPYYNNRLWSDTQGLCEVGTFAIPFDWHTTSTFTSCTQFKNDIGPSAGSQNGQWLADACTDGFHSTLGHCATTAAGDARTACEWGAKAQVASVQGCLCLLDSKCNATQVLNSDYASTNSITGLTGDSVSFVCDFGYYMKDSDLMKGGSLSCGSEGTFQFETGSNICIPIARTAIAWTKYRALSPESKVRLISRSNSKHFTDLQLLSHSVKDATRYSKVRVSADELPIDLRRDITNVYQSQKVDIYTQNLTLTTDQCEKSIDCCDIALDISTDTTVQAIIPKTTLQKTGFCRNPIQSIEECISVVNAFDFSAHHYIVAPSELDQTQQVAVNQISATSPHYGRLDPSGCFLYKESDQIKAYFNSEPNSKTDCSYSNRALGKNAAGCLCSEDSYEYVRIYSGFCENPITTADECLDAVNALLMPFKDPYSAASLPITEGNWSSKAPGCSISKTGTEGDDVVLYFNTAATSKIFCNYKDGNTCVCKSNTEATPVLSLPNREGSWSITCNKNKPIGKKTLRSISASSSFNVISSSATQQCTRRITEADSCTAAASALGISGAVQIVSHPHLTHGCFQPSFETIATGQCEELARVETVEECQSAVGFWGHSGTVAVDASAPYGCSLKGQTSTEDVVASFNPDLADLKDVGSSLLGTSFYKSLCRNKKAYLNLYPSEIETPKIGCSEGNRCLCYGDKNYSHTVQTECWDDYLHKWDTSLDKKGNYYNCNHHKMSDFTNTIVPMECPAIEIANSDKSSIGSVNGTIFTSVQVNCDDNFAGGGTSTCDYHIDKNKKVEAVHPHHQSSGICEKPVLSAHDCYAMAKSLTITQLQMHDFHSHTHSTVFVENGNNKCVKPITSPEECYRAVQALGLDILHATQKNVRTIRTQLDNAPSGCILWKVPSTNQYIPYFNPKLTSQVTCNTLYTACICKSETHFEMNTHELMCQNIEQMNSAKIEDIHVARDNKWASPFTSVDLIPDSFDHSRSPQGCFLYKVNNDNQQLRAYFNPHDTGVGCAQGGNSAGCLCHSLYTNVSSGTCQSNGHVNINDKQLCQDASHFLHNDIFEEVKITTSGRCDPGSYVDTFEECQKKVYRLNLRQSQRLVSGTWSDKPAGCILEDDVPLFNIKHCDICGGHLLNCSNTSKCLCSDVTPTAPGCIRALSGDTFLNSVASNTECSESNRCLCKADIPNNRFYSSHGSCLSIGDGYAPVTTKRKCLEAAIDTSVLHPALTTSVVETFDIHLPPNCLQSNNGNLILNTAPSANVCTSGGSQGCFCEKKYFYVQHGTCDSNGYAPIASEALCKEAAVSLNHPWLSKFNQNDTRFASIENASAPPHCWEDKDGSLFWNGKISKETCSATSGCFCQKKKMPTFEKVACKVIADCAPTEVAHSKWHTCNICQSTTVSTQTGLITGKERVHVTCNAGYSGGGKVTCDQYSGLFSTANCHFCSKGYGYASTTNHTCVRCSDLGGETGATYNDADNSNGICAKQTCPFGMGMVTNNSLNIGLQQDCVKCPEETYSDSSEHGQCQNVAPGYIVKTNETLNNLLQVVPPRVEAMDSMELSPNSVQSTERIFIYEKELFEMLSIPNSLLCELNLMMAKAQKTMGLLQRIEIEQGKCWIPSETILAVNQGRYFVKDDGTKDTLYLVSVPNRFETSATFRYDLDGNTIVFSTPQYSGTFAAITNPTPALDYGEFILNWSSNSVGAMSSTGGLISATVDNDGHYILQNYVQRDDEGMIQEEFLYRDMTDKWTKTRRERNGLVQTKTAMRSSYDGTTVIDNDLNGAVTTSCYGTTHSSVYEFEVGGVTTNIHQMAVRACGGHSVFGIPFVNVVDIRELDLSSLVSRQIRIGQIEITCLVDAIAHSQTTATLTAGQSIQVQYDPGYGAISNDNTFSCPMEAGYDLDSVQSVALSCASYTVEHSNASTVEDALVGVTGESFYVQCDSGYEGGGVSECMTSGYFSTVVCSRRACSRCNICFKHNHLEMYNFDAHYQDTVQVQCKPGYSSPSTSVTCQSDGIFSSSECSRSACFLLVANSNLSSTVLLQPSSAATVQCDLGYEGGGTVVCNDDAILTPNIQCTPITCVPTAVPHSDMSQAGSISGSLGQSVSVQCDPGYVGSAVAECLPSGTFSTVTCSGRACSTTDMCECDGSEKDVWVSAGSFDAPYYEFYTDSPCDPGSKITTLSKKTTYTFKRCNSAQSHPFWIGPHNGETGIVGSGELQLTTGESNPTYRCTAHPSMVSIIPVVYSEECNCLVGVQNTQLTSNYGQKVPVQCQYGYQGGGEFSCDVDGLFNLPRDICTRKKCLLSIAHSNRIGPTTIHYQEHRNVQCDDGYEGGGTVHCGVNGESTNVVCMPKECAPTQIYNSNKAEPNSIQGAYGETVEIKCNPLHRPSSSNGMVSQNTIKVTCLLTGLFQTGECQLMYNFDMQANTVVRQNHIATIANELRSMHVEKNERKQMMAKLSRQLYTSTKIVGLTKREAVKLSKLEIIKDDFDVKILNKIPSTARKIYIIPAPPNAGSIDTCANGLNDDDCCTYSFSDDADMDVNDIQVHETGEAVASWSVLCKGDVLVSKQTREHEGFKMECWDKSWKVWKNTMSNMTAGEYYKCHSHTILVGSQTPLGATCETNTVSGSNYSNWPSITAFVGETVTVECDTNHIGGGLLTCDVDGNFSTNDVTCFPVYDGKIQYDCQTAQRIYQEGLCCGGAVSTIVVHNDRMVSCHELSEQYKPNCGCGSDTDMVVVSLQ